MGIYEKVVALATWRSRASLEPGRGVNATFEFSDNNKHPWVLHP